MRRLILTLFAATALFSCADRVEFTVKDCKYEADTLGASIWMSYPRAEGQFAVVDSLNYLTRCFVNDWIMDDDAVGQGLTDPKEIVLLSAAEMHRDSIRFDFIMDWSLCYNAEIVSMRLNKSVFTGGAHPNGLTLFYNRDIKTGASVDIRAMITDTLAIQKIATADIRAHMQMTPEQSFDEVGMFVEGDLVPLSSQMGFTPAGLVLFYNQYEIACYAVGTFEVVIPYDKLGFKITPFVSLSVDGMIKN